MNENVLKTNKGLEVKIKWRNKKMECLFYDINEVAQITRGSHDWVGKIVREMNKKMLSEFYRCVEFVNYESWTSIVKRGTFNGGK